MFKLKETRPKNHRRAIREILSELFPSDTQLDAFTIDYFIDIHQQFAASMSRTQRLNILLERLPPEQLWRQLSSLYPVECAPYAKMFAGVSAPADRAAAVRGPTGNSAHHWNRPATVGAIGVVVTLGLFAEHTVDLSQLSKAPQVAAVPAEVQSVPTSALVYDAQTGEYLGSTPWRVVARFGSAQALCLQRAGYCSQLVEIAAGSQAKQIQLVPRAPTTETPANCAEECHVPLSILP